MRETSRQPGREPANRLTRAWHRTREWLQDMRVSERAKDYEKQHAHAPLEDMEVRRNGVAFEKGLHFGGFYLLGRVCFRL